MIVVAIVCSVGVFVLTFHHGHVGFYSMLCKDKDGIGMNCGAVEQYGPSTIEIITFGNPEEYSKAKIQYVFLHNYYKGCDTTAFNKYINVNVPLFVLTCVFVCGLLISIVLLSIVNKKQLEKANMDTHA